MTSNKTDTDSYSEDKELSARISDEDIERAKRQIGISNPIRWETHSPVPCDATIRNFTWGYGDDNPLYQNPSYAKKTRWKGLISPPTFPTATGVCEIPPLEGEKKKLFKGLFRGVGKYYSGVSWEWYKPIYSGDKTYIDHWTSDIKIKNSSFSGGRSVIETWGFLNANRSGDPVAVRYEDYINAERGGSKKAGKYSKVKRQSYDPKDIEEIDAMYAAETRRGDESRFWEDVNEGDQLGPIVKGPLTQTDIIAQHVGWGMGEYGPGPLRYASKMRRKMPAFFTTDKYGIPDVVQRLHWDSDWAESIGLPAPYDYGQMRTSWMVHLLTNWMGDDAWLWKASNRLNGFNFLGDRHIFSGSVQRKYREESHCCVEVDIVGTNQRNEDTVRGNATIILPSKEFGPIILPDAPNDLRARAAKLMALNKVESL